MEMNLSDIIIKNSFKLSVPSERKIKNIVKRYINGEEIGKEIIVDESDILVDGYIRYLILKYAGVENVDVTVVSNKRNDMREDTPITYVYARHKPDGKLYVWRITRKTKHACRLEVGARIRVATKHGDKRVVVEKIEALDNPPLNIPIRKVKECYKKSKVG